MSTEISPLKVIRALQRLNEQQSKEVMYHLGVPLNLLDDIDNNYSGIRKIRYVQVWFDHDVTASWEKLVSSLRMMGLNSLADSIATEHCPWNIPPLTHPFAPPSTDYTQVDHTFSTQVDQIFTTPLPPPHSPSGSLATPTSTTLLPPSLADRVTQTRAEIDRLGGTFCDLTSDSRNELCLKETADPSFTQKFCDCLLNLSITKKPPHYMFLCLREYDFLEAKTIKKLFAILRRYWDYRNYEILHVVVKKFCAPGIQQRMDRYCVSLKSFEKATTIDVFFIAESAGLALHAELKKMMVTINKPANECTLHDVRKLKEEIAERVSLETYSVYINHISLGSVNVQLGVHPDCVGKVLAVMTPDFLQSHLISNLTLGQDQRSMEYIPHHSSRYSHQEQLDKELLSASESGDLVRTTALINNGANANTMDNDWREETPLYKASERGNLQIVCLLIGRGSMVDSRNWRGRTPLMIAAGDGHVKIVMELLSFGADVNAQNKIGWTPLMIAALYGHVKIVMELLSFGADVNAQDKSRDSALMLAAYMGNTDAVIQLVKLSANLDIQNKHGDSALIRAITSDVNFHSKAEVVKELVRGRSNLNLQNNEGLTALMIAIRRGRSNLINILLEGEDIDLDIQQNDTGWSALFFAAERGDTAITQALIKAGANPNLKDKNGLTALDIASASDKDTDELCKLLTEVTITTHCPTDSPAPDQDTTHSQQDSPAPDQDTTHSKQDRPAPDQDTTHSQQDRPAPDQDTTYSLGDVPPTRREENVTEQDVLQIPSSQRRQRRNISETMMNLVNRSRKRVVEIFNQLDRRLKSTEKKQLMSVLAHHPASGSEEISIITSSLAPIQQYQAQHRGEQKIPSYYTSDEKYPGILFFGKTPWKKMVTSTGAHIDWMEDIGVEFDIPPGAVPEDRELELSVWPCSEGPFVLPEDYEFASPVYLISPSFHFTKEITLHMKHFSKFDTEKDAQQMAFLSAPSTPLIVDKRPIYHFKALQKGEFDFDSEHCKISLTHFCKGSVGRKRTRSAGSKEPSTKKQKDENRYVYQVYQDKVFEDRAIFSAFLDQPLYFTELKKHVEDNFSDFRPTYAESVCISKDKISLEWPDTQITGWEVTPDRKPCRITRDQMNSVNRLPYPPVIKLEIERLPSSASYKPSISVTILGVEDEMEFILKPKPRQNTHGFISQSSVSSCVSGPFSPPSVHSPSSPPTQPPEVSQHQEQGEISGVQEPQTPHSNRPKLKDLVENIKNTEWYYLGLQLTENVKELDAIESDNKNDTKKALRKMFQFVLEEDPELSWEKVVGALRSIGLCSDAKTVEEKFCQPNKS